MLNHRLPTVTAFLLTLIIHLGRSSSLSVTVSDALNVARGTQTTLNDLYKIDFNTTNTITSCSVVYNHQGSSPCGIVWPSAVPCSTTTAVTRNSFSYQHYGCLAHHELLNFKVEVVTNVTAFVEAFSISVHVVPATDDSLYLRTEQTNLSNQGTLTVLCPQSFISKLCSYSVSLQSLQANVANNTNLSGPLNQPISCGYSPDPPFSYNPLKVNAISVMTTCLANRDTTYHIVPIANSIKMQQVPTAYFHIEELMETPIPPSLLPISELSKEDDSLEFLFSTESTGGIYSLSSSNKGFLDVTTFTLKELKNGRVLFRPNEKSIAAHFTTRTKFHYYVLSWTGLPLAKGALDLKISPRTGLRPSVRKNVGIVLKEGEKKSITARQLNFYPPDKCFNYTITITASPQMGALYDSEGNSLNTNDKISVFFDNVNISYQHDATFNGSLDLTQWRIQCSDMKEAVTTLIPLRILPKPKPTIITCDVSVASFNGFIIPLFAHSHSLCGLPITNSTLSYQQTLLGQFLYLPTYCSLSLESPGKYYIRDSDLPHCVRETLPQTVTWNELLYRPNGNEVLKISLKDEATDATLLVNLQISIGSVNYTRVVESKKTNFTKIQLLPYVEKNRLLPVSSSESTFITSNFLSVHSSGYLTKEVVFRLVAFPQNGYICLLQNGECATSVKAFTQEDIFANNVYYKSHSKTKNDSFRFQIFYTETHKLPSVYQFVLAPVKDDPTLVQPLHQFWVNINKEKILTRKYLKHFRNYFGTKKLVFTILEGPAHGLLNTKTNGTFSWQDILDRAISYKHLGERVCSDRIMLQVTAKKRKSIISDITIAIRVEPRKKLSLAIKGHRLQGEYAFALSTSDFEVHSGFCLEYVRFSVVTMPGYGFLQINDTSTNVLKKMTTNGSFFGDALKEGRIVYRTYPDLVFIHQTEDEFQLDVSDPKGSTGDRVRRGIDNVFFIYIDLKNNQSLKLNLTVVHPKHVTRLDIDSNYSNYGAVLGKNDMYLSVDSDFVPSEVYINIINQPNFGNIYKDGEIVSWFSLEELYANKISYVQSLLHTDTATIRDELKFYTYIYVDKRVDAQKNLFSFEWCYFDIVSAANPEVSNELVKETQAEVTFTVRRIGANDSFSASVDFVTEQIQDSDEAAANGVNCTTALSTGADFCKVNKTLSFSPREIKQSVSVQIIDNSVPEGMERFYVDLKNAQNCFISKASMDVSVIDNEDYSIISFHINQNNYNYDSTRDCPSQISVPENINAFNLTLVRKGFDLNRTDSVICYTSGLSNDHVSRPRNSSSLVYFRPGEKYANCTVEIVNDNLNEPQELFLVELSKTVGGYAYVDYSSSPVCVLIEHDKNDLPFVAFKSTKIFIKEKRKERVLVTFTVKRFGTDLRNPTKVSYILVSGTATPGLDYETNLMSQKLEFGPGVKEASGAVSILPDVLQEGNETFFIVLRKPYGGRKHSNNRLEVVIINSVEDMTIGLSSKEYRVKENEKTVYLPLYRHGDISVITNVTCILQPLTADFMDVFTLFNQTVIFPINSTSEACSVFIQDDQKREGEESVLVTIVTADPLVKIANNGTSLIIIDDIEDAPLIQFNSSVTTYIQEPLSNYPIDYKEVKLTLSRTGDLSLNTSIQYYTSSADGLVNYQAGVVDFLEGDDSNVIKIHISFDPHHKDRRFYVYLQMKENEINVQIGPMNKTLVVVKDTILTGPLFPAAPQIKSFLSTEDSYTLLSTIDKTLYYDLPLACITPCDLLYNQLDKGSYIPECAKQAINNNETKYIWHVSRDGVKFDPLVLDTLFTDTRSQILESVYLRSNIWITCTVTATDMGGVKGYVRTSPPILLDKKFSDCGGNDSEAGGVTFSTYKAFHGQEKDFVQLSVNLPAVPNTMPILTTHNIIENHLLASLLTRYSVSRLYPCSSVPSTGNTLSLLPQTISSNTRTLRLPKPNTLYRHYKPHACRWRFQVWLPLKLLIENCAVNLTSAFLSMTLHVSHIGISNGGFVLKSQSKHTAALATGTSERSEAVLPFSYYPIEPKNVTDVYFSPVSIEKLEGLGKIRIIGYSHSNGINVISLRQNNSTKTVWPVYTVNRNEIGWLINVDDREKVLLKFKSCHGRDTCMDYIYRIDLSHARVKPKLNALALIEDDSVTGHRVLKMILDLDSSLILRSNFTLKVSNVKLCQVRNDIKLTQANGGCDNSIVIRTVMLMDYLMNSDGSDNNKLVLYFEVDSLTITLTENYHWYIHASCVIKSKNDNNVSDSTALALLYSASLNIASTNTVSIPSTSPVSQSTPTYVTVLFFVTLIALMSTCGITLVLIVYAIRRKWLTNKKKKKLMVEEGERRMNNEMINRWTENQRMRNNLKKYRVSRRKNSLLNSINKQHDNSSQLTHGSTSNRLHKSKSLPDLSTSNGSLSHATSPIASSESVRKSNHLISELQSLTKKERTNVLIATVKPLSNSSSCNITEKELPTGVTNNNKPQIPKKALSLLQSYRRTYQPQGVGWYERYQSRQKALALYAQMYQTADTV